MVIGMAFVVFISIPVMANDQNEPAHENLTGPISPAGMEYALTAGVRLGPMIQAAANEHNIPVELLLALGQLGSAFEDRHGAPTIERGYGIMALRENATGGDSLMLAAKLTGTTIEQLKIDPAANIQGTAAVLDSYARELGIDRTTGLDAWIPAIARYAGLDQESNQYFTMEVYQRLATGFTMTNSQGESFTLAAQRLNSDPLDLAPPAAAMQSPDYPPATWDPAPTCNYTAGNYGKDTIIIHTIEGSAAGARSWIKNCNSSVSAHYVVSEAGGVWQMVREYDKAWHVGCYNSRSIGIEHEGYASSPSHPQSLYDASADLCRDICNDWGIPKAHTPGGGPGIMGHGDANACCCHSDHWDPGSGWDWNYFINRINGSGGNGNIGQFAAETIPAAMRIGHSYNCTVSMKNAGTNLWAAWPIGTMLTVGQYNGPEVCKLIPYPFYEIYIPQDGGSLPEEYITRPGATCTFPFTLNIPGDSQIGNYEISWQMKDNNEWFNSDTHSAVFKKTVYIHDNESSFVSDTIPATMVPGGSYGCSITMKNAGSQMWACWPSGTMLTVGQFDGPVTCKLIPYPFYEIYTDPCTINQGENCTFPFTINVPSDTPTGDYTIKWEMKDNGTWFGQIYTKTVKVISTHYAKVGEYVGHTIPTNATLGQSYNCTVSVKNTGTELWAAWPMGTMLTAGQANGPQSCKLIPYPFYEIYIPQDGGSLPEEYITRPGAICTFPFQLNIPADALPGVYEINCQMKDNSEWFNSDTHDAIFRTNVTVNPPPPPVITAAVSRKTHGAAGAFDIDLKSSTGVENRKGGATLIIVTFNKAIQGAGGLSNDDVLTSSGTIQNLSIDGNTLQIQLSGVTETGLMTISFPGIADAAIAMATVTDTLCIRTLLGDVSGDGNTNVFDLLAGRNMLNKLVQASNYRSDTTVDGQINVFDLLAIKNNLNKNIAVCP